ncbi:helix-turn-helix transcriptional regulator [Nocardia sp. BMG111209]|uniref:helix-turn-helix transcriptional regulator n=1 Tax=Nocardia sp. BMG111209 TaxID=1160137 RepID=UPI0003766001|nr:helix-turn-helix transcriptional regulator [Nocardia sp. BMG111209]
MPDTGIPNRTTAKTLGQAIKKLRLKLGMSRKELAEKINRSWRTVEAAELGARVPITTLADMFEPLEVAPQTKRHLIGLMFGQIPMTDLPVPEPPARLIGVARTLPAPALLVTAATWYVGYANDAARHMFPGLELYGNLAEWLLLDRRAQLIFDATDTEETGSVASSDDTGRWLQVANILLSGLQHLADGTMPEEQLRQLRDRLRRAPAFGRLWSSTEGPLEVVAGSELIMRDPKSGETQRVHLTVQEWVFPYVAGENWWQISFTPVYDT